MIERKEIGLSTFVELLEGLRAELESEQHTGRVNSLAELTAHQIRRQRIDQSWQGIEQELRQIKQAITDLPALPPLEQVRWAQVVEAIPSLAFLEIDTTGLQSEDEMIRFTLVGASGEVFDDWLIQPIERKLQSEASAANGIAPEQLEKGLPLREVWPHLQAALAGSYVLSFNQEWDRRVLQQTAERHGLEPLVFVGECLQRHATQYYHREYYLTLEALCERVGAPLPAKPHQTSIDRARGQRALLQAFAQAITDVRPPQPVRSVSRVPEQSASASHASDDFDPFLDGDALP